MPSLETLTLNDIPKYINDSSIKKGRGYVERITNPQRTGNRLKANVRGTQLYATEVEVKSNTIITTCSCSWGGNCKHVAALLLKWIYSPNLFQVMTADSTTLSNQGKRYPVEVIEVETPPSTPQSGRPAWMETAFAAWQAKQQEALEQQLQYLVMDDLRQIANSSGWTIRGTRKADLARQIAERMLNQAENERLLKTLDAEHVRTLVAVALVGSIHSVGFAMLEKIAESFGTLQKHKKFITYLDHLFEAGLIFHSSRMQGIGYGEQARIPTLRDSVLPPLLAGQIPSRLDLPETAKGGELRFAEGSSLLRALEQLMLMFEATPPALRQPPPRPVLERFYPRLQGWDFDLNSLAQAEKAGMLKPAATALLALLVPPRALSDAALQQLSPVAGDETRLEFLYRLMLAAGMVQPGSPVHVRPQVRDEFFRYDDASKRALLARIWFGLSGWNEIWEVIRQQASLAICYTPPQYYGSLNRDETLTNPLINYRKLVLSGLSLLPDNEWVDLDDFFKFYKNWWKGFNHKFWNPTLYTYGLDSSAQSQGYWYVVADEKPLNGDRLQDWLLVQGNFIRFILQGPLTWLGLVDLHLVNGEITHFRLHGLRDLFLNRVEAPPMPAGEISGSPQQPSRVTKNALAVKGDTIEVNPTKISGRIHSLLERIAKRIVTQPDKFVYKLDLATTHQSFESGLALSDLSNEWKELVGETLPTTLAETLQGWWESYGQVRIYQEMTIIELSDDHALTEMKALTSLNKLMLVELSPRLVVIPQSAMATLMSELQKAGYTPKHVD